MLAREGRDSRDLWGAMVTRLALLRCKPTLLRLAHAHHKRDIIFTLRTCIRRNLQTIIRLVKAVVFFHIPVTLDTIQHLRPYERRLRGLNFNRLLQGSKALLLDTLLDLTPCLQPIAAIVFALPAKPLQDTSSTTDNTDGSEDGGEAVAAEEDNVEEEEDKAESVSRIITDQNDALEEEEEEEEEEGDAYEYSDNDNDNNDNRHSHMQYA